MSDAYAGTDRVKDVLLKRREQLKDNPEFRQYVFGREDGGFVASFDRPWKRLFGLAKINRNRRNGLVWHTLRHEFVSRTLERTGDPVVARAMARHKDVRTTQGYLHAGPKRLLAAAVALNRPASSPPAHAAEARAAPDAGVQPLGHVEGERGRVLDFPKKSA